jgi:hypothetical protein
VIEIRRLNMSFSSFFQMFHIPHPGRLGIMDGSFIMGCSNPVLIINDLYPHVLSL